MIGSLRKLQRFFHPDDERSVVLALDHGAGDGMLSGLARIPDLLESLKDRPVEGVVLNKGLARAYASSIEAEVNLVVQLSGGTKHGVPAYNKSVVCSVPEALRVGADAVAMHINIGNDLEDRMLQDFGMVTDEAHQLGLPVMAVIYATGGQIVNGHDPALVAHCIRLGGELGADLVCAPYPGEMKSYSEAVMSCPVPVLMAGGPTQGDLDEFLATVEQALKCGAAGVSVGRNVFQHEDPIKALDRVVEVVHGV